MSGLWVVSILLVMRYNAVNINDATEAVKQDPSILSELKNQLEAKLDKPFGDQMQREIDQLSRKYKKSKYSIASKSEGKFA